MSDNKKFKCIPQNLSMSESAPVCQPWSYASAHPMSAMLKSSYFLSAHDRLRPGDTIRIVQMKDQNIHARDNKVLSFADAMVLKTGKDSVDMHIEKRINFDKTPEDSPEENIGVGESGIDQASLNEFFEKVEGKFEEKIAMINDKVTAGLQEVSLLKKFVKIEEPDHGAGPSDPEIKVVEGTPTRRWNPGKGEHQAVVGEGDDLKVLFSHKDKKEVDQWLQKSASSTAPEEK